MRMMKLNRWWMVAVAGSLAFAVSDAARATSVFSEDSSLGGTSWERQYTIVNDSLGFDIEEFTIFFEVGLFQGVTLSAFPLDWDVLAIEPDAGIPDDGFVDALALASGISSGGALTGLVVIFDYLGTGAPGAQRFDVVDPSTFEVLDSGVTVPIPEPGPALLMLLGLGWLARPSRGGNRLARAFSSPD